MQPASAKAKGRLGQQEVVSEIDARNDLGLDRGDIKSRPMGSQGDDLMMSPRALKRLYFDDWEVKRRKRISVLRWFDQLFKRKSKRPIICCREDRSDWYCIMRLSDLLELLAQRSKDAYEEQKVTIS